MGDVVAVTEQIEVIGTLIDHPILRFYEEEVSQEIATCDCDDCDPCDYEAR